MPRYYFDVHDDLVTIDDEGAELVDIDAARERAMRAARSLMCEQLKAGQLRLHHLIEVMDANRRPLLSLPFGSVVEIEP